MPNYDMHCPKCDIIFEDMLLSYEEAHKIECPNCTTKLNIMPARFGFEVTGSKVRERQKLEARFKRRSKRLDKQFTKAERDNFDNFCRKHSLRRYY